MAMNNLKSKQKGIVLVVSLVMIIAVTAIAVTLLSSSSIDIKMTSAAQESEVAIARVKADSVQIITQEKKAAAANNRLLYESGQFPVDPTQGLDVTPVNSSSQVILFNSNAGPTLLDCPIVVNPTPGIKCNMLRIEATLNYGKHDSNGKGKHNVTVSSGIAQEMGASSS
ncbi:pilus assembly PilX family protein [Pseudoalteromonas denitrificans]|nr:hypothetical protein [Pseudoalteromonas denitrificans]